MRASHSTVIAAAVFAVAASLGASAAGAASIIDEWASVKVPPAPALKPVTVDPKTTALLMLDFIKPVCNPERGKRCMASLVPVKKLLDQARAAKALVIYTGFGKFTRNDVLPEAALGASDPFVVSFLNKYIGTELEKMLKDKNIDTVITVGTAANGAVLTTSGASAERGFKVVVPVDGMSSDNTYAEQYTAWHLTNAPVISSKITLTRTDMVKF
jgi:nicotinamidase-related amidase